MIKTFFTEVATFILDFRCVPGPIFPIKLTIQSTVPGLRLDKSIKIIENFRITISQDHNSQDCLSINHFIHNEACIRTYEPPCIYSRLWL